MGPVVTHPPALALRYDPGRSGRQVLGFGIASVLMAALGVFGVWMIIASFQQLGVGGRIVGCGFGILFLLLSLATLVSAVEVFMTIRRDSRQEEPLLLVDETGVDGATVVDGWVGADQRHIGWDEISRIDLTARGPGARRAGAVARLDPELRLRQSVTAGLDRTAGTGLGMRDGRRSVELVLVDGRRGQRDLTLPLSPETFAEAAPQIVAIAEAHGVEVWLRGDDFG